MLIAGLSAGAIATLIASRTTTLLFLLLTLSPLALRLLSSEERMIFILGLLTWVSIEAQPIRDEDGTITQLMAIECDITEALEREQPLGESRRKRQTRRSRGSWR